MGSIEKVLDFIGTHSWAAFVLAAFVLFIPDDAAKQIGVEALRDSYKGYWWLALVLTGALWAGSAFRYFDKRVLDGWLERRREKAKSASAKEKRMESLRLRLSSLDAREQMWIKYCIYNNQQTLSAKMDDVTAQSLMNKHILIQGSGSMLNLPFHIADDVWELLQVEAPLFLSEEEARNPKFTQELESFRRSLLNEW